MQRKRRIFHVILLTLLCCSTGILARRRKKREQKSDEAKLIRQELDIYRNRNTTLDRELEELQKAMDRDSVRIESLNKEHKELHSLLERDLQKLVQEEEELKKNSTLLKKKIRSLEWWINREKQRNTLLQKELLHQCDTLQAFLETLPNAVTEIRVQAVLLLKKELKSNTIETVEAAERLFTIYDAVEREIHTTDVWQSGPPQMGISGVYYYIRVGLMYTAAVADNGTAAYRYSEGEWNPITSPSDRLVLLRAAESAVGTRTPELSSLPMRLLIKSDSVGRSNR